MKQESDHKDIKSEPKKGDPPPKDLYS